MNKSSEQILNLLTICRKAGKLAIGFDSSVESAVAGKAYCYITASDASPKTKKELLFQRELPCIELDVTRTELAFLLRKKVAVMAVCDEGFAKRFQELTKMSEE